MKRKPPPLSIHPESATPMLPHRATQDPAAAKSPTPFPPPPSYTYNSQPAIRMFVYIPARRARERMREKARTAKHRPPVQSTPHRNAAARTPRDRPAHIYSLLLTNNVDYTSLCCSIALASNVANIAPITSLYSLPHLHLF